MLWSNSVILQKSKITYVKRNNYTGTDIRRGVEMRKVQRHDDIQWKDYDDVSTGNISSM